MLRQSARPPRDHPTRVGLLVLREWGHAISTRSRLVLAAFWTVLAFGRYIDRFEKRNGEWRMARRVVAFDWATGSAVTGESILGPNYTIGRRYPDDVWDHILDKG